MVDKWDEAPFSNICEESAFGPRFSGELYSSDGNVAILRTTDISMDGRIEYSTMPLARLDLSKIKQHILRENDLVITRSGRVGTAAVFEGFRLPVLPGAFLIRFRLRCDVADPYFYRYYFNSIAGQKVLLSVATGSVQQNLNITSLHGLYIPVPSLNEQRAITRILGTLDDKIELNRRMNETLEAIARAIFKSWFVDFDPVRAKAEGREPAGMDAKTAALFPDSFEEREQGMVPTGWATSRIGDELKTILGGTPSRSNQNYWINGTIPWVNSGKINEFRIIEPSEYITDEALTNSATKLLPARTSVLAITGATLGKVSLLEISACANQSVIGIQKSDIIPSEYIYFWIKHKICDLTSWQTGGAQQHINKTNVNDLVILIPETKVLRKYLNIVKPIFDKIKENHFQSKSLTAIRDLILPKLLSGEIPVNDLVNPREDFKLEDSIS